MKGSVTLNNIKHSKEYITDALLQLMNNKKYENITITDIANKAGVTRVTFYRNFKDKDDIIKQHLQNLYKEYQWDDKLDSTYQLFDFFIKNKKTIDLLYKSNLQYYLVDNLLVHFGYKKDDPNVIAYSKVMVAYLVFGLCDEWYKRGMIESPEEIISLINHQKKQ